MLSSNSEPVEDPDKLASQSPREPRATETVGDHFTIAMTKFCEYIGAFGGVCMEPQASEAAESGLLQLCKMHLELSRRERARRPRFLPPQMSHHHEPERPRHIHSMRCRSGPYLSRPTSGSERDERRVVFLDSDDEAESMAVDKDSSPLRWRRSAPLFDEGDPVRPSTPVPEVTPSTKARRKRVRVKKIVVPSRFEVLEGEPSTPPKVWYVRINERVEGEPGNPEDDEYIEIDEPDFTFASHTVA